MSAQQVFVPDIGDFDGVDVIEVLVQVGDSVSEETPLITLESDKATMEIPSPVAGVVESIVVKVGDNVSEGDLIVNLATSEAAIESASEPATESTSESTSESTTEAAPAAAAPVAAVAETEPPTAAPAAAESTSTDVRVPDIGDFPSVDIIEVLVAVGDAVAVETPLVTLESDKATMEIPSPAAGTVAALAVSVGDSVAEGDLILSLTGTATATPVESAPPPPPSPAEPAAPAKADGAENAPAPAPIATAAAAASSTGAKPYAGPAVRKLARELGVDLAEVSGTGHNSRITADDVKAHVKAQANQNRGTGAANFPAGPGMPTQAPAAVDFSRYGEVETVELPKLRRLSAAHLHHAWVTAPHVTQFDDADITELEAFRKSARSDAEARGVKLTLLAFLMKASVAAIKAYPDFSSSLSPDGAALIRKHYFNIGFAADTEHGLVVPVVRDVDAKGLFDLAEEIAALAEAARARRLGPEQMQGGCFTITSLGGIGGTAFTPIINSPEVAILGVSRSRTQPVYIDGEFQPRLLLPLSLSYDHRVIDGAMAARFTGTLSALLGDIRKLLF